LESFCWYWGEYLLEKVTTDLAPP